MANIKLPANLRALADGEREIMAQGENLRAVLEELTQRFPDVRERLFNADGEVLSYVSIFVDGNSVRELQELDTKVEPASEVLIVTALAGG